MIRSQLAKHGKLEPRRCSVLCKANVRQNIWVICQAAGDWRPSIFRELLGHSKKCAVLGLDVSYERNWNQRAYICRRQRHGFEIAEYSNGMDSFSRLERGPEPLILSPMIVNWLLNPTARFETTFSTPDTFQEQILTEIYDKTRVYWRTKAEIRFFLVDFVPFFEVSWSRRHHDQETT